MAVTVNPYGSFLHELGLGGFNFSTDEIYVALFGPDYTPNLDTDETYFDIKTNEVGGTGYFEGGVAITQPTWTYDAPTRSVVLRGNPLAFGAMTVIVRYAVMYKIPTNRGPRLIGCIDLGETKVLNNEELPLSFTDGYVRIYAMTVS